jgi:hypothetical protein
LIDDRFDGISDEDLWAEWLRRRAALRARVTREYQREYKRRVRAGVKKGKRGMQLMKQYRPGCAVNAD